MEEVKKELQIGDKALADGRTEVEILHITPHRLFSTVRAKDGYTWDIMTRRLTELK